MTIFLKAVSVGFFIRESIWLLGERVFKVVVMASAEVPIWEVHEQRNKAEEKMRRMGQSTRDLIGL